ncbi:efflux RND transporter periplasmic adaptor subunit [Capnocytophaga sp.]|uniref:efflux RND transporter periplasmic adaptor subunit n=1 Tax=Capnocytophaga sp. TaxID=44737 RepID=UPI0026DAE6A3|nr:efflux RND transporter periplasmic adaptor subunit [Capnocytophaga sp.]MDO5105373.1 efflux RND transporter periplasmic adaptor subunit [Capnocytophaga sp.]
MKKIITSIIVIATIGFVAYKLYSNKEKNAQEVAIVAQKNAQVVVRVQSVSKESVANLFTANGMFAAQQDLNVAAEMGGQIVKIYVKEGDFVKAGQALAHIKADRVNVGLEQAKAVLDNAQNEVKRFENAYQTGGVTQQQLEQVRLQLKNAQANYNSAQISSGDTSVRSKISGIISSKFVEEGSFVGAGTTLFNVVNIETLKLQVTVDENQVSYIKVGETAQVMPSVGGNSVEGKVTFVAPKSNGALKFPVEITVPNKDKALKAGMYARAQFSSQNEASSAQTLIVPRTAFVGSVSQNKIFKFVNGRAQLIAVKSGRNFGEKVEILEGLAQGDQVIVSGQINLEDGTPVKVLN